MCGVNESKLNERQTHDVRFYMFACKCDDAKGRAGNMKVYRGNRDSQTDIQKERKIDRARYTELWI